MRAFIRAVLIAVGVSLFVVGCGDDEPTGPSAANGSMTAMVDGEGWAAIAVSAGRSSADIIGLSGTAAGSTVISMAFTATGPGTYAIPQAGMNFNYSILATNALWQALGVGQLGSFGSGSVTITTLSENRVVGTFQFRAPPAASTSATGEKVVTQGVFDIPLVTN